MEVFGAFPTPIGMTEYTGEITEEILNAVRALDKKHDIENDISISTNILETIPELSDIHKWIKEQLYLYFLAAYEPEDGIYTYITHSWATFTKEGEGHHMHTHPNSLISGVFYLNAHDTLSFSKSEGYQFWEIPTKEWNEFNSQIVNVETKTGRLVLFPSKLLHHVPPINYKDERIAIAFNSFIKGTIGSAGNKTQLELI